MAMKMPSVFDCTFTSCAYNLENRCHALAITVGGGDCPECDTAVKLARSAGDTNVNGGVGACKVETCQYNRLLECTASGIHVKTHEDHAECGTFAAL